MCWAGGDTDYACGVGVYMSCLLFEYILLGMGFVCFFLSSSFLIYSGVFFFFFGASGWVGGWICILHSLFFLFGIDVAA